MADQLEKAERQLAKLKRELERVKECKTTTESANSIASFVNETKDPFCAGDEVSYPLAHVCA